MTRPRKDQINVSVTPYDHIVTRCVRRAFLCGDDPLTKRNFDHRRDWIVERLRLLSSIFTIDISAYAIMSNHHHVVLRVDANSPNIWTMRDTIERWHRIYKGNFLSQRYLAGHDLSKAELSVLKRDSGVWKERLISVSWFMRALNEPIVRAANAEDECTGKFLEARFKSQALLDEKAILACMVYVDLNPIRAQIAKTLEDSNFTSIQSRTKGEKDASSSFLASFSVMKQIPLPPECRITYWTISS